MESPLSLKAALLQALFAGPGDRLDLMGRVAEHLPHEAKWPPRAVLQSLRELEAAGLVRHWGVRSGERRAGDASVYYELTVEGVAASSGLRDVVAGFAGDEERRPREKTPAMDARLRRSLEISALAQNLRRGSRKLRT